MLKCPICGGINLAKTTYFSPTGEKRENILCLDCGRRSLTGFVDHLILSSGNIAIKIKKQKVVVNSSKLVFENGVAVEKIKDRYVVNIFGEPLLLTFGTRLRPKSPPYPLSLLK
jgi:hypothetical protein